MKRASQKHLPVYVSQVSVTALLDMVLILLLVFIVAVPFLRRQTGPAAPAKDPTDPVILAILPDQSIRLADQQVSGQELMEALKKLTSEKPDAGVLVKMPSNFAAGSLARLMEEMHRAGIRRTAVEVVESKKP